MKTVEEIRNRIIESETIKADDVRIKKVKVLHDRARETANKMGLKEEDLVNVRTHIKHGCLPVYELEKIEGSPISYLQNKEVKKLCK